MPTYTLTILDTVSIQNYIFGSNRLKENVGASELVKRATQLWVYELLPQPNNVDQNKIDNSAKIEEGLLKAELFYAGGGNTVILFANESEAKAFVTRLSERLIIEAPGIELAVVHQNFDWEREALGGNKSGVLFEAFNRLADIKRRHSVDRSLAGLGVTALCQSTGQAATFTYVHKGVSRLTSTEVAAKLDAAPEANRFFDKILEDTGYSIPFEFDEMGRSEHESSYIAVVHADGNGLGKRFETIAANYSDASQNRDYILHLRDFSQQINTASNAALESLIFKLVASITGIGTKDEKVMDVVPIYNKFIPLRPLVFGGDDLTFVCEGRLALTLTAFYLKAFEEEIIKLGLEKVHACAGIAIVKTHYPFMRAYQLAEVLCREAKDWVKEKGQDFSALDWHFAPSGIMGELAFIREREYRLSDRKTLLMRPIAVDQSYDEWRHWSNFEQVICTFKDDWANCHNKVMRLREALRAGEIGVKQFVAAYPKPSLPEVNTQYSDDVQKTGWAGEHCAYFDAIEAMDFFIPLYGEERSSK